MSLRDGVAGLLTGRGIDVAVIGAAALAAHGVSRATADLDLDRFFYRFAGQNQFKHYLGVTYVAVDGDAILGFATVVPGHVEIDDLPASA